MMTANVDGGYLEALLRGYRAGILTSTDYANLTQCESIDGTLCPRVSSALRCVSVCIARKWCPMDAWPCPASCTASDLPPPRARPTDMKMHLSGTDYGNFLQNEASPVSTTTLALKSTEKLVEEFNFLRIQSVEPLSTFLDYIT